MSLKKIRILTIAISFVLVCLILVQIYWIRNAISLKDELFSQNVTNALQNATERIEKMRAYHYMKGRMRGKGLRTGAGKKHFVLPDSIGHVESIVIAEKERENLPGKENEEFLEEIGLPRFLESEQEIKLFAEDSFDNLKIIGQIRLDTLMGDSIRIIKVKTPDSSRVQIKLNADRIISYTENYVDSIEKVLQKKSDIFQELLNEMLELSVNVEKPGKYDPNSINQIIKQELNKKNIHTGFSIGIFNPNGKVDFINTDDTLKIINSKYGTPLTQGSVIKEPFYLKVYFPDKNTYILSKMGYTLTLSVSLMVILIAVFYFTISSILRQKKLSDIKNDFVNNMTHELKTPISSISLACEAMNDPDVIKDDGRRESFVKVIREENERLSGLVDNVLQNALADKEEFMLEPQLLDITEIIKEAIAKIRIKVEQHEGNIYFENKAINTGIMGDRMHLLNSVLNIIDNAVKYAAEAPIIYVKVENSATGVFIKIKDNGIGIGKEEQKKIFDKFYRVPTGNLHDVKGFGLGLSYVKGIMDKHEGSLEVQSELGKGSEFILFLPFDKKSNHS